MCSSSAISGGSNSRAPLLPPSEDLKEIIAMSHSLDGRIAIVTGAARGIGLGIAQKLKADGARVAIWDLDVANCDARRLGFEADHLQEVDVASHESVGRAFDATVAALGHIDILVNNAG